MLDSKFNQKITDFLDIYYILYNKLEKEHQEDFVYSLHLYFNGLSLRNTSKAISRIVTRSHTAIRDWIQKYKPERLFHTKTKISEFIIDEKLHSKSLF